MKRVNLIAIAIFLALLAWVFMLDNEQTGRIQGAVLSVFSPFLKLAAGSDAPDPDELDPVQMAKKMEEMQAELDRLRIVEDRAAVVKEENERYRKMLEYEEQFAFSLIAAKVLSRTSSNWWNSIVIDRGRKHGIEPHLPVLTPEGLVGKTAQVGEDTSVVILLTDERCRVAARIQGTSEQGIVMGQRGGLQKAPDLIMRYLSKGVEIPRDRKVYSSGKGKVFPPGIVLGTIRESKELEIYGEATLVPEVDFTELTDVFVVEMEGRTSMPEPVPAVPVER